MLGIFESRRRTKRAEKLEFPQEYHTLHELVCGVETWESNNKQQGKEEQNEMNRRAGGGGTRRARSLLETEWKNKQTQG